MNDHGSIQTLADILPFRAAATPGSTALRELDGRGTLRSTTFAELKEQVDAFAAKLYDAGVRPGCTVALAMRNSARWIIAYYAVFRLGAVAVPLEHGVLGSEPGRIRHALEHAEAAFVVCDSADVERIRDVAGGSRHVICADEARGAGPSGKLPAQPTVKPSDLAQILYTSGTTGPNKGVELTHGSIIFDARKCCERFALLEGDCLPAVLPYHHAFPLTATVILPLYTGACMAIGDITDRRSRLLLRKCRPTMFVGVPRVFESMLRGIRTTAARTGQLGRLERAMKASHLVKTATGVNIGKLLFRALHRELFGGLQLRFCVAGGARIPPSLLRQFFLLGIPLLQGWGMSELSPVGAVQSFRPSRFYFTGYYERKAGSIGTPLDGTEIVLAPSPWEEMPLDGESRGEVLIRGPHVMRGYHKDPELTARQITPQGLRSGDIARRDEDGDLYIIGRIKHVIVLPSGKKVFPEDELEEELSHCTTIEEFTIRPISDESGAEKIGIIVRPNVEELAGRGVGTLGQLYDAIKKDVEGALRDKPDYMKHYDFCLTSWRGDGFAELVTSTMGDPCPLKNPFVWETSYSRMKGSPEKAPFSGEAGE